MGMQVAPEMLQIKHSVLSPPAVSYGGGRTITPDAGAWNLVHPARTMSETLSLLRWCCVLDECCACERCFLTRMSAANLPTRLFFSLERTMSGEPSCDDVCVCVCV